MCHRLQCTSLDLHFGLPLLYFILMQTVKRRKKGGNAIEGQVTVASIADATAKQKRIDLAKEIIELQSPIIQHGTFEVPLAIILASGEQAVLKLVVAP